MATEKQIAANRMNALKSTGPKTEEGKARASFNAIRHGLRADTLALPYEDPAEVQEFVDGILAAVAPRDAIEAELAAEIATLSWKLRRAERVDNAYLSKRMLSMVDRLKADGPDERAWNIELAAYDDDEAGRRRRRYVGGIRSALSRARRELLKWREQHPPVAVAEPEAQPDVERPEERAAEETRVEAQEVEIGSVRPEAVGAGFGPNLAMSGPTAVEFGPVLPVPMLR